MRSLLWILALGLLGLAALWIARRLVGPTDVAPTPASASPTSPASATSQPVELLQPEASAAESGSQRRPGERAPDEPRVESLFERPEPAGLEEGGLAQAARPLPDLAPKYAGIGRAGLRAIQLELRETERLLRDELSPDEVDELSARLANQPLAAAPSARVAEVLRLVDERAWVADRLSQPAAEEP